MNDVAEILYVYPSQNETGSGCLSKIIVVAACCASTLPGRTRRSRILPQPQAQSHMRNMLPSRFELRVSFWNRYKIGPVYTFIL